MSNDRNGINRGSIFTWFDAAAFKEVFSYLVFISDFLRSYPRWLMMQCINSLDFKGLGYFVFISPRSGGLSNVGTCISGHRACKITSYLQKSALSALLILVNSSTTLFICKFIIVYVGFIGIREFSQ